MLIVKKVESQYSRIKEVILFFLPNRANMYAGPLATLGIYLALIAYYRFVRVCVSQGKGTTGLFPNSEKL